MVEDGYVVGVLTQGDLLRVLPTQGEQVSVSTVMRREFEAADSYEMLDVAFGRLQTCECHTIPVTHDGALVGLVTMDKVGEFLRIQSALGTGPARA